MNPSLRVRPDMPRESARTGLVLLDSLLRTVAMDQGGERILADCIGQSSSSVGTTPSLPQEIVRALQGRNWPSISGTTVFLAGATAKYRCTLFRVEPHRADFQVAILALHFQTDFSTEDAINDIAKSCNLTDRELEVMKGLSTGLTSKEIAAQLDISPNTVKSYVRLIMLKLGANTRSGVVGKLLELAGGADNANGANR
jgi:DNA-binding CsgD family transcriptional regulator